MLTSKGARSTSGHFTTFTARLVHQGRLLLLSLRLLLRSLRLWLLWMSLLLWLLLSAVLYSLNLARRLLLLLRFRLISTYSRVMLSTGPAGVLVSRETLCGSRAAGAGS